MLHDGQNNACPADSNKLMGSILTGSSSLYLWSSCSADYLSTFLRYKILYSKVPNVKDTRQFCISRNRPSLWIGLIACTGQPVTIYTVEDPVSQIGSHVGLWISNDHDYHM